MCEKPPGSLQTVQTFPFRCVHCRFRIYSRTPIHVHPENEALFSCVFLLPFSRASCLDTEAKETEGRGLVVINLTLETLRAIHQKKRYFFVRKENVQSLAS